MAGCITPAISAIAETPHAPNNPVQRTAPGPCLKPLITQSPITSIHVEKQPAALDLFGSPGHSAASNSAISQQNRAHCFYSGSLIAGSSAKAGSGAGKYLH
jgi:hypothetical protein